MRRFIVGVLFTGLCGLGSAGIAAAEEVPFDPASLVQQVTSQDATSGQNGTSEQGASASSVVHSDDGSPAQAHAQGQDAQGQDG
ncbi:hypothetical protein [Saccharopolyspora pogona]|uniref:hypothetical protein n=1 Tax=Saccharopolyspora pogona TaxID=333966 RepID=UPI00168233B4|nr:hypothetical protein [Saccharopolyspora pogona]